MPNQQVRDAIVPFSAFWILCTQSYVYMRSTGETEPGSAVRLSYHHIRYLILNFGNVANLDFNMW